MENFKLGLLLMVVGMTSVYIILLLVIGLGKWLIYLINKYAQEEVVVKNAASGTLDQNALPGEKVSAIVSAINVLTGGQGKVTKIEKG